MSLTLTVLVNKLYLAGAWGSMLQCASDVCCLSEESAVLLAPSGLLYLYAVYAVYVRFRLSFSVKLIHMLRSH